MHIEFVRVNRTLDHHFTEAISRSNKHHLVETGFGINGKHHARRTQIGTHHSLHTGRQRYATMVVALMHAVRDGAVVKQGSINMLDGNQHGIKALHVEEGFLLAGEGSVRHIFCRGGRTHRERGFRIIGGELLVGFTHGLFQRGLERCFDNPLADLLTRFSQFINIINIGLIQQIVDTLIDAALIEELIECI